ncbi:MAG: hypothetical protein IPL86_11800 [Flavobacteriales bacterium]|nr:hypothetical protein [Flavobacteriales bacterium]
MGTFTVFPAAKVPVCDVPLSNAVAAPVTLAETVTGEVVKFNEVLPKFLMVTDTGSALVKQAAAVGKQEPSDQCPWAATTCR